MASGTKSPNISFSKNKIQTWSLKDLLRGYSFVELMVVIMIMVLMFSVGMANYRDFQRRQSLESASRQIRSDMRLAQGFAFAARKTCTNITDTLRYYQFRVGAADYFVEAICETDAGVEYPVSAKTVAIPAGFDVTLAFVRFKVLGQGTNLALGASQVFTITNSVDSSLHTTVTVYASGEIR